MAQADNQARIIPFPTRAHATPRSPDPVQLRLQQALASLEAALAVQRQAVAEWRSSSETLQDSIGELYENAASFQDSLTRLSEEVSRTRAQSERLAAWADTRID